MSRECSPSGTVLVWRMSCSWLVMESYWKAWAWPCSRRGGSGGAKQVLCDERPLRGGRWAGLIQDGETDALVAACCSEEGREDGAKEREEVEGGTEGSRENSGWRAEGDGLAVVNRHASLISRYL